MAEVGLTMDKPRFTFCIPNLNKIDYLPACIDSMLAQDCGDWQCVFVDGYSTDGCWEYMQQFVGDPRFRLLRGLKQGMYADWNECLRYVDTEYFYILTSDDTCYPELVSKTTQALDQYLDIDICHFQYNFIDADGITVSSSDEITNGLFDFYRDLNQHMHRRPALFEFMMHFVYRTIYTTLNSLVIRSSVLDRVGEFSCQYGPGGDFDWTMRLSLASDVLYLPELLASWRRYDTQASSAPSALYTNEIQLKIAEANLHRFMVDNRAASIKHLDARQLLNDFCQHHAGALYREAFKNIKNLYLAISQYPFYIPNKIMNRLSFNNLYRYPKRIDFAWDLVRYYDLELPTVMTTQSVGLVK
jgi:glycosyltransferase involved in cell wall biosynthesis